MSDWPFESTPVSPILTPWSVEAAGAGLAGLGVPLWTLVSGTSDTANKAYFYPFRITSWVTVYQVLFWVGATSSGNIDVGVYDAQANRIVSAGSTAMSATVNTVQEINVTDTVLSPGKYFLAWAVDNTTGTVFRTALADELSLPSYAVYEQTGLTAAALPATATPVISTSTGPRIAAVGLQLVSVF